MVAKILQRTFYLIGKRPNQYLGRHIVAEFWRVEIEEDMKKIEEVLIEAAKKAGATPIKVVSYKFLPYGFSAMMLLAESHIALHYWPEKKYLAVDIFACGKNADPQKALDYLKEKFKPQKVEMQKINRGRV